MITENGYELDCSGRKIPFTGINLALLSSAEFAELKGTDVDMISHMEVRATICNIEKKIDMITTSLKAMDKKRYVDDKHIVEVVESWYGDLLEEYRKPDSAYSKQLTSRTIKDVKEFLKNAILTTGGLSKAVMAIGALLFCFGVVIYIAVKLAI